MDSDSKRLARFLCVCGNEFVARINNAKTGNTKSCGCKRLRDRRNHSNWKGYQDISGKLWSSFQRNAERRDILFSITIEQAWELFISQDRKCALTGWEIHFARNTFDNEHGGRTASLDRKDSKKGYFLENVQWVHKDVNWMKQDFTDSYFVSVCKAVVANLEKE